MAKELSREEVIASCGGPIKYYWMMFCLSFRSRKWLEAENERLREELAKFEQQAENEAPDEEE